MVMPGVVTRKPAREVLAAGTANRIDRLPRDQHRHHGGFARARGQLQGKTKKLGVGVPVGVCKMLEQSLAGLRLRGDLDQPNGRFGRFHLAEERADAAKLVVSPMLKQARRFGSHLPMAGMGVPASGPHGHAPR